MVGIYLKDYLRRKDITSDVINVFDFEKEKLKNLIQENPDVVVAISTSLVLNFQTIKRAVDYIKSINQDVVIILGGQLIFNMFSPLSPEEQVKCKDILKKHNLHTKIDFIISNEEGEMTLLDIVHNLKNDMPTDKIPNVACKENKFSFNPYEGENNNFENYVIKWNEIDEELVGSFIHLMTSKGCPFKCKFCTFWKLGGRRLKYKNLKAIEGELDSLSDLSDLCSVRFVDDTFTLPVKRFQEICKLIIKGGHSWNWSCYARATSINEESAMLMKQAGCDSVFIGLESGSDKMLKLMGKEITVDDSKRAIEILRKNDIFTYGYLICGYPGETEETIKETIDFLNTSGLDAFELYRFFCHPLMTVYEERSINGLKGGMFDWSHNTMDSDVALEGIMRIIDETINSTYTYGGMDTLRPLFGNGFARQDILNVSNNINLIKKNVNNSDIRIDDNNVYFNNIKDIINKIFEICGT